MHVHARQLNSFPLGVGPPTGQVNQHTQLLSHLGHPCSPLLLLLLVGMARWRHGLLSICTYGAAPTAAAGPWQQLRQLLEGCWRPLAD